MVLDVRAQVVCNLGPVISGSVKDDHVQGQGLVFTTGELTLAGLITPAHGTSVTLAYVTPGGDRLVRFPRGPFRVVRAFANPLSNQTEIQLANELAYQKGKGGGTVRSALVEALNGRVPKAASVLELREAFGVMASRVGLTVGELGSWSLPKQIAELDSPDYIETMGEILASVGRFGYLDGANVLQTVAYSELGDQGPQLGFAQIIDLSPNAGGLDFSENPSGSGTAQQISGPAATIRPVVYTRGIQVEQGSYGRFSATWDNSNLETTTQVKVSFFDQSQETFPVTELVTTSEQKAEPDNRVTERRTRTTTSLVKLNSQVVQDYINLAKKLNAQGQPNFYAEQGRSLAAELITTIKTDVYEYEELAPPPISEEEQAQIDQEIESVKQQESQSGEYFSNPNAGDSRLITLLPKLPTYRKIFEQTREEMSYAEALGRLGVPDYTKFGSLPSGTGLKEVTEISYLYGDTTVKEFRRVYVAYGLTQMGQQAIAAAAARYRSSTALDFQPLLDAFFDLVLEDQVVTVRDAEQVAQDKPIPSYLAPFAHSDVVLQGGSRIQLGDAPQARPNKALSFAVPFLPDDVVNDDGTVSQGNGSAVAAGYAEQQNRLLLGHRLGLQVTTALGLLPSVPLGAFHISNGQLAATYRTNGTVIAFDASSCLVSTDALYWGLAGGDINGGRWTPVAPGTTALPVLPELINNGPQLPANSIALAEAIDVSDQTALNALLDTLPDDEPEVFELELAPPALVLPFKPITTSTFEIRLQAEAQLVPLGIHRNLGAAEGQLRLLLEAVQAVTATVRLQLESSERQVLVQPLSASLNLQATLG